MVAVNYGDAINPVEGIPKRYVIIETKFRSFRLENKERSFSLDKLDSVLSLTNRKHGRRKSILCRILKQFENRSTSFDDVKRSSYTAINVQQRRKKYATLTRTKRKEGARKTKQRKGRRTS